MAASSGGPRRSSTRRRRLNAILLSIIGFVVLLMIIGALAGPHGTKPSSAQSNVTLPAACYFAAVDPETTPRAICEPYTDSRRACWLLSQDQRGELLRAR